MKKLCSGIMALSIVLTSVNFPARASEPDTDAGMEVENFSEADSMDEFQDSVIELNESLELESDGKYASRRLIVLSDTDGLKYLLLLDFHTNIWCHAFGLFSLHF